MKCSNSLCTKPKTSPTLLTFKCEFCKQQNYCSKSCRREDWDAGHSSVCKDIQNAHRKKVLDTNPFIKPGQFLTDAGTMAAKIENIHSIYEPYRKEGKPCILGKGSYGEVILMKEKASGQLVAMKIINKESMANQAALKSLLNEIEIQKRVIHDNIIRLFTYVEDTKNIYIVMEYASKGSLFHFMRKKIKFAPRDSFIFFTQACSAIQFLHSHNLMHRDIKPENLLITEENILKLCDFGCCTQYDSKGRRTFCGTLEYMAPELIKREGYTEKADIWSLGVLLYELLHGYAPHHGPKEQDTMNKIVENRLIFGEIAEDAKQMIQSLMREDAKERPEAWEIFELPWMKRMQHELGIPDSIELIPREQTEIQAKNQEPGPPSEKPNQYSEEIKQIPIQIPKNEEGNTKKGPIAKSLLYVPPANIPLNVQPPKLHSPQKIEPIIHTPQPSKAENTGFGISDSEMQSILKSIAASPVVYLKPEQKINNSPAASPQKKILLPPRMLRKDPVISPKQDGFIPEKNPSEIKTENVLIVENPIQNHIENPIQNHIENLNQNCIQNSLDKPIENPIVKPIQNMPQNQIDQTDQEQEKQNEKYSITPLIPSDNEIISNQQKDSIFSINDDIPLDKPKMKVQVDQILSSKNALPKKDILINSEFPKYERGTARLTRKNPNIKPKEDDKDNIFHKENRRSTWIDLGFPTFNFEPEQDPLFHVNKFLEETQDAPKMRWQDALGEYKDKITELGNELNKKLLGNNTITENIVLKETPTGKEEDLKNVSFDSDDYAFQRSETVLKAVNYLDDVDADPTLKSSIETADQILHENTRLKKVCGSLKKDKEKEAKRKPNNAKDESEKFFMCHKMPEKHQSATIEQAKLIPNRTNETKEKQENELLINSEYNESIVKIMGRLMELKHEDNRMQPRKSQVVNMSRKTERKSERMEKNTELEKDNNKKDALWSNILMFNDKDAL